jgi:hypothetical protein
MVITADGFLYLNWTQRSLWASFGPISGDYPFQQLIEFDQHIVKHVGILEHIRKLLTLPAWPCGADLPSTPAAVLLWSIDRVDNLNDGIAFRFDPGYRAWHRLPWQLWQPVQACQIIGDAGILQIQRHFGQKGQLPIQCADFSTAARAACFRTHVSINPKLPMAWESMLRAWYELVLTSSLSESTSEKLANLDGRSSGWNPAGFGPG